MVVGIPSDMASPSILGGTGAGGGGSVVGGVYERAGRKWLNEEDINPLSAVAIRHTLNVPPHMWSISH